MSIDKKELFKLDPSCCIKCGMCEKACPQHLKVRDLLEEVEKEFEAK